MCSGKNGAGSPQGGYNPAATGGMQQFTNLQNQYAPDNRTGVTPYSTGNPSLMASQPGLASTMPVSSAQNMNAGSSTGGLDPNPAAGRPTNTNPDPSLGSGYVTPEMGLLGGGSISTTPNSFVNGKPVLNMGNPFPGSVASGGMTPQQWAMANGNGANGGPAYNADGSHFTRDQRLAANGFAGGPQSNPDANRRQMGWANNQYNPVNRDPNGPANRMAGAAAYQQSLTPEMLQQQINNGQRAPTSSVQMEAMLANMSPEARADYLAKSGYRTPTTGGNIFGN